MNNNTKKRIFIAALILLLLFLLMTFAGGNTEYAVVEFIDGFDNSVIDTQNVEIGEDAEVPKKPKHKNYVFAGWFLFSDHDVKVTDFTDIEEDLKVIALYAGDRNNNGIDDEKDEKYTVTFIDGFNNNVIKTEDVLVGMDATAPNAPTHTGYTFVGWDKGYTNITKDTSVTAEYNRVNNPVTTYIVTFIDGDTDEVITTQNVRAGNAATLPEAPVHENRVFVEWIGDYTNVNSNRTITATYTDDKNNNQLDDETEAHYNITYVDYNDEVLEVIEDVLVDTLTPTIADPQRENYEFKGWNPEVAQYVTNNATYKAEYEAINDENNNEIADEDEEHYTITYVDYNDEVIKKYENVLVGLETPTIENPTREYYTFNGWTPSVATTVTDNATYKATYTINNDENEDNVPDELQERFDVVYKDYDGNVIKEFKDVLVDMTTPAIANPTREHYTFEGWTPSVAQTVTEDAVYTGTYKAINDENNNEIADEEEKHYTITYVDYNDEVIKTYENVLVGLETPTIENPTREYYTFNGWTPSVASTVTANAIYKATYTINNDENNDNVPDELQERFDVVYKDYDGNVIKEFKDVLVDMTTPAIANPTREYYTFNGWTPEVARTVTDNATYKATYTINNDVDNDGKPDESEEKWTVNYYLISENDETAYKTFTNLVDGQTTPIVENPTREHYTFEGWNPNVAATVTENQNYVAVWAAINDEDNDNIADEEEFKIEFIVDQKVVKTEYLTEGQNPTAPTVEDTNTDNRVFTGWNPTINAATKDAKYTAQFAEDINNNGEVDKIETKYTINYLNKNGSIFKTYKGQLKGLATPTPETNPIAKGFVFNGWENVNATITGNANYASKWLEDKNEDGIADKDQILWTVKFYGSNNTTVISEQLIVDGQAATAPTPQNVSGYEFKNWSTKFNNVKSNLDIYPSYNDVAAPNINAEVQLSGTLTSANINITVTDNSTEFESIEGVAEVKYLAGVHTVSEYNSATSINKVDRTYTISNIKANGVYTIFAKDAAGNIAVKQVEVEGIIVLEGEFEDLYAEGSFGTLNGILYYSRRLKVNTKANVKIVDARMKTSEWYNGTGYGYATIQQFKNDLNFGTKIETKNNATSIDYKVEGWEGAAVAIYVKYEYLAPGATEPIYVEKLYKTRLGILLTD